MKVTYLLLIGLLVVGTSPLALTACPTCLDFNFDLESVGEMESSPEYIAYQDFDDEEVETTDGFEAYDHFLLDKEDNEEIIS